MGKTSNPYLNTNDYEVQFPDGHYKQYGTNVLVENLFWKVDSKAKEIDLLASWDFCHHSDDSAIKKGAAWIMTHNGRKRKPMTKGWKFNVQWRVGSMQWIPLKDMKNGYTIKVTKYAVQIGLVDEPIFPC